MARRRRTSRSTPSTSSWTSARVVPSIAGPKRPQDRVACPRPSAFRSAVRDYVTTRTSPASSPSRPPTPRPSERLSKPTKVDRARRHRRSRSTTAPSSSPRSPRAPTPRTRSVMLGAALLAKKAVEKGLHGQAVGQDHPGPRVEGRHRLLRPRRPDAVPGQARLQPRRLRLHHLHRQLRPAARARLRRGQRGRPRRRLGAFRQPQLRGPDQPGREDELPRLAAAGHRLRHRRHDGLRLRARRAGHRHRGQAGVPQGHLARPGRGPGGHRLRRSPPRCSPRATRTSSPATSAGSSLPTPTGNVFEWDADSTYVRKPPYFEGMPAEPGAGHGHRRRARAGQARRLGDHRPHLPGRLHQGRLPGRQVPGRARRGARATSTPTARGAATTR